VDDLADSAPTANTLRVLTVCFEPHLGQITGAVVVIDLANFSKWFLQDSQVYS
jgi:hypothetical protein